MMIFSRAARSFALLAAGLHFLLGGSPALAQGGDLAFQELAASLPRAIGTQPSDPWLYRGTDIPVDDEWLFGELGNGLRYAVRRNGVPPNQVSIRVRIDAGSLHEDDDQRGFAHLIEHLSFRESKYLKSGEAIPTWQRLGATFGSDTNALTTPTQTVYRLDLPNAHPGALQESFRLLSGMIREPALSQANLQADIPIVLAELRESGGAQRRVFEASQKTFYQGQLLAQRGVSGDEQSLSAATEQRVRDFHSRWYRPEKALIVAAGDADPEILAALIEYYFADWPKSENPVPDPDFGRPTAPEGADPANPIGATRVLVEPDLPRSLSYIIMRPWEQVNDNIEYNRGLLLDAIAQSVLNRRLENRARAGGSYLFASAEQRDISRSSDITFVSLTPLGPDWRAALQDVRAVIADAQTVPPSQEEIDAEVAQFDVYFANMVEQRAVQAGGKLADDMVNAVDIREAVAAPETVLDVFRGMQDRLTPDNILEHTRGLFRGDVIRSVLVVPDASEADDEALKLALLAPVAEDANPRLATRTISFEDLPPIGGQGKLANVGVLGVLDMKQYEFANGVRAVTWRTTNEPGRATVRVRFGAGYRAFAPEDGPYIELGKMALVGSGIGPLGQNELDRLASGRKLGLEFRVDEGTFVLEGETRPADVADQLYLLAAKLAMPRWDANPVLRSQSVAKLSYDAYSSDPAGVVNRDLDYLLHDGDRRYASPTPAEIDQTTPEGFRKLWEPILKQGPVEVMVFGDFDENEVMTALFSTFGALPDREAVPAEMLADAPRFPVAQDMPTVLHHRGDANQGAAIMAWPTGGGSADLPLSRKIEVLSQVFSNRLLDAMREQSGASYAPQVFSEWPVDVASGGKILALAQIPPDDIALFFNTADEIAADLIANGPGADELARVTEPLLQHINRVMTGHQYWMSLLEGVAFDPLRGEHLKSLLRDYTEVTPADMQQLAGEYLAPGRGWQLAVIPENQSLVMGGAPTIAQQEDETAQPLVEMAE